MLKIFGNQFSEPVMFGIGPEMRIEPRKTVCSHAPQGGSKQRCIGIKNGELVEQFFGFAPRVIRR